jgi:hypothetical protein
LSFQLNPPHVMSEAVTYSKVSSEMTSMMGHTTAFRFLDISARSGSWSQFYIGISFGR